MTNNYNSDLTFLNLQNYVLRELKEPENTGSEAVSLSLVQDTLNDVYAASFNDRRMKQSARENNYSFTLANDTTLVGDAAIGDTSITLSDSSTWRPSGKAVMLSDIITYTGNSANILTGVTGLQTKQVAGALVRQMYNLADIAPTIQGEEIHYLDINGLPQQFLEYDNLITQVNFTPNTYTVYKGHLLFSRQATLGSSTPASVLMVVTEKVVPMSSNSDTPALIPNSWRVPVLVYGACMKIAASDAFRTSWDWWKEQYETSLSQYVAFRNCRVKDVNNRRRPSIWNSYSMFK